VRVASSLVKTVTKSTGRNDPETPLQKPRQRVQRRLEQRLARQNDMPLPLVAPVFPAGMEPLPPGMTEEDRANLLQAKKYQDYMAVGMESCLAKTTIAGVGGMRPHLSASTLRFSDLFQGFAIGGFFSMMSSSFAYEDPLLRQNLNTTQKTKEIFKEMGRGMWRSGKGFGKVGALFAGIECVIESVRGAFYMHWPSLTLYFTTVPSTE
jgi:import inner membrane translocase subunit TIM22